MVRYVLWTVYNCVFGHKNSPGESHVLSLPYATETNMIAFRHKFCEHARLTIFWLFFGHLLYDVFGEGLSSVHLSEQLANVLKI